MKGAPPTAEPLAGRVLGGRFEIRRAIGAGAWGMVYEARHVQLQKRVAVKVLRPRGASDPRISNRFVIEARLASQLDHPHCVRVFDFGRDEDLLYIAMEYLEGENLRAVLEREKRIEPARAARIMLQTASVLGAAHAKSILHRDIKPANIILTEAEDDVGKLPDFVKVCDFGLAKMLDPESSPLSQGPVSIQGAVIGTPAFMSPEQARGEPLDQRTDIFSWGAVFYALLSGRVPYESADSSTVVRMPARQEPVPLQALVPDLDPRLESIVARAMAQDRDQRTSSARELRIELERFLGTNEEPPTERASALADTLEPVTLRTATGTSVDSPAELSPRTSSSTEPSSWRMPSATALVPRQERVPPAAVVMLAAIAIGGLVWVLVLLFQ